VRLIEAPLVCARGNAQAMAQRNHAGKEFYKPAETVADAQQKPDSNGVGLSVDDDVF
jgi:hypothetical protein